MYTKKTKFTALILAIGLVAMLITAACNNSEPEALNIAVAIKSGAMEPKTIKAKQGDMVTLKILADDSGEFHLHTYDIEADIPAGQETDFYFEATATGRFKITYHPMAEDEHEDGEHGEGDAHGGIFKSKTLAPGESFFFEVHKHLAGTTIPFHSHLRPALNGSISVSRVASQTGSVAIEYTDKGAQPHEVNVGPGTVITWTNNSSVPQTVISGHHADMAMGEHKMDEHKEAEEIQIGLLEVQPR